MIFALLAALTCADFNKLLTQTYGFRPSQLNAAAQMEKSRQMDAVWRAVQKDPATLGPCLGEALKRAGDDNWFRFDGSQLLVSVDHSPEARATLFDAVGRVPLDDVDLRTWVHAVSALGLEGFDTTALAKRWMSYPKPGYSLPEHGAYVVDRANSALFIYGSLDEKFATPALVDLIASGNKEQKEIATWLLMSQATTEALNAVAHMNADRLSKQAIESRKALLEHPALIDPRKQPLNTRAEFMSAFNALLNGDERPFDRMVAAVEDGERDLVAVMTPADLDTIRRVRRHYAAANNQHAIEYYNQFSQIIMTAVWKPELVK